MHTIIRLHKTGDLSTGVYRARLFHRLPGNGGGGERHPAPWEDSMLEPYWTAKDTVKERRNWFFGFETIDQVRRWFYEDSFFHANIDAIDISVIRVLGIQSGYTQAIFDYRKPRIVRTYSLESVFDWDNRDQYLKEVRHERTR